MGQLNVKTLRQHVILLLAGLCLAAAGYCQESSEAPAIQPEVTFETDLGSFTLLLFPDKAPATVANFLKYCDDNFYLGTIFHRVVPGFVVQGGGLTFDYVSKETRDPVVNESNNGLKNLRGTVAMARMPDPDSATSQFYVNLATNPHLDAEKDEPGYTVFGEVVEGMETLEKIAAEPIGKYRNEAPDLPIRILSVNVDRGSD